MSLLDLLDVTEVQARPGVEPFFEAFNLLHISATRALVVNPSRVLILRGRRHDNLLGAEMALCNWHG